ncbi:MAG: Dabb family protein [Deltaproteobacteria bacterium]|jgi:hypothetical protein|nr:Dabb family protein [Deltaproteobacteria bacterium]
MTTRICSTACLPPDFGEADRTNVCKALERLAGAAMGIEHSHAGLHLEGSQGAGDLTWDFTVPDAAALEDLRRHLDERGWEGLFAAAEPTDRELLSTLSDVEAWVIEPLAWNVPRRDLVGIKRTNLVRVLDSASPEAVEHWSRDLVALALHVPAIRNWSLARTRPLGPTAPRVRWTHAWEQEFETLEGLVEDYMASPYHWGWLDGWYNPEVPFCIMDRDLAHLYCVASQNVLGWASRAREGQLR